MLFVIGWWRKLCWRMINMIDVLTDEGVTPLIASALIEQAVKASCVEAKFMFEPILCVRFASDEAVKTLNEEWRNQDKVTDILSFPMQEDDAVKGGESLGDMILAQPFVQQEALRLGLSAQDHSAHLIVHGTLHLLGYDHITDEDAVVMQSLENRVMAQLGLHQPYPELHQEEHP